MPLEPLARPLPGPLRFLRDLSVAHAMNALIGFVFAASGPLAIILTAGTRGGLSEADIASWIFGALFGNGLLSILFSALYRQPLVFFWTIPGTVLVGPALMHASYAEVIGAFLIAGLAMLALGLTGLVRRVMDWIPLPIVMGMVAGVFLPFGLDWLRAIAADPAIAATITVAFLAASALPKRIAVIPPMIAALLAGIAITYLASRMPESAVGAMVVAAPVARMPAFSWPTLVELVAPLIITVLVVQNGQGVAVLRQAGHAAPVNAIAAGCGLWSMLLAPIGTVSTCLTGPVNAIISASGEKSTQYTAGILVGVFAIAVGLFAPTFTKAMLAAPPAFIATLAGLAMLRVLQSAFTTAFGTRYSLGSLTALLVTVAGIPMLNIGAPFWGLVAGVSISRLLEHDDYRIVDRT